MQIASRNADQIAVPCMALSELTTLAEQLKAMSKLDAGTGGGCMPTVAAVLETLARCRDPVLGARRLLASPDADARLRGLEALQCFVEGTSRSRRR